MTPGLGAALQSFLYDALVCHCALGVLLYHVHLKVLLFFLHTFRYALQPIENYSQYNWIHPHDVDCVKMKKELHGNT